MPESELVAIIRHLKVALRSHPFTHPFLQRLPTSSYYGMWATIAASYLNFDAFEFSTLQLSLPSILLRVWNTVDGANLIVGERPYQERRPYLWCHQQRMVWSMIDTCFDAAHIDPDVIR